MCSGGGSPPQVTPAPAPAPPEPAPVETSLTDARRKENEDAFGTAKGPSTRINRADSSTTGSLSGGSGLRM